MRNDKKTNEQITNEINAIFDSEDHPTKFVIVQSSDLNPLEAAKIVDEVVGHEYGERYNTDVISFKVTCDFTSDEESAYFRITYEITETA